MEMFYTGSKGSEQTVTAVMVFITGNHGNPSVYLSASWRLGSDFVWEGMGERGKVLDS